MGGIVNLNSAMTQFINSAMAQVLRHGLVVDRCVQFEARPRGLVDGTQVTLPA
jgi:hypothetical protein